jgi:hypothetical protein
LRPQNEGKSDGDGDEGGDAERGAKRIKEAIG